MADVMTPSVFSAYSQEWVHDYRRQLSTEKSSQRYVHATKSLFHLYGFTSRFYCTLERIPPWAVRTNILFLSFCEKGLRFAGNY